MCDAPYGSDLLLSLRFNGSGPDCILRRRVKELGLRRRTRGHRAGLHCVRSRRSYVLTSSALGSVPVITGNRPLPARVVGPDADPASMPTSSAASSRIPDVVDRRATDCLIRPDPQRHACHPTRQLMCATLNIHSIANKLDVVSQCWRDHGLDVLGLTETWPICLPCLVGLHNSPRQRSAGKADGRRGVFYRLKLGHLVTWLRRLTGNYLGL